MSTSRRGRARPIFFLLLVAAAATTDARAASFDCAQASSVPEKLICASPALSALDDEMAGLYGRLLEVAGAQRDAYRADQRQWLKNRRNSCATAECLAGEIQRRSAELRTALERAAAPAASTTAATTPPAKASQPAAAPQAAATPSPSPGRAPQNPTGWAHCTRTDLSPAQFQVCEDRAAAGQFKALDEALGLPLRRLEPLKASLRQVETGKAVAAAAALWARPEAACPNLDAGCLGKATQDALRKAQEVATNAESQLLPQQKAAEKRYFASEDAMPLVITNGGGGNKRRPTGEYVTSLSVENHTSGAFSELSVACGLFETWGDEKSVEPEFNHTIRAGIAPKSRTLSLGYVNVPWDLAKWGTDAQIIKCRVVGTKAATAAEAQAAIEANKAETALIQRRTQAAMNAWDAERERKRQDQSADQLTRLNAAIAALAPTPTCQAYGQSIARERTTVVQWQRAGQNAYPIVQGLINEAKRMGCL